jgi:hypothetical protein
MYKTFIKGSEIKSFKVENNKVFTTIELDDLIITNPTLEQFLSTGWEEYTPPAPEPYIPTLEELVEQAIRGGLEEDNYQTHYSQNQEFHLSRLMANEDIPEEVWIKWKQYNDFVERCITWAKSQPHRD